ARGPAAGNGHGHGPAVPADPARTYADDLLEATCARLSAMKVSLSRDAVRSLPLPLLLLVIVADVNSYRLAAVEGIFGRHLCSVVGGRSASDETRVFANEMLVHFVPLSLSGGSDGPPGEAGATAGARS
ncbi:hypothetical protein THAOC_07875, partial [Thalassiosira oceanica]